MRCIQILVAATIASCSALAPQNFNALRAPAAAAAAAAALILPGAAFASGASLEQAAKNAEAYRVTSPGVRAPSPPRERRNRARLS